MLDGADGPTAALALAMTLESLPRVRLSDDDLLRREVITALMCHGRVEFAELEARHGIRFLDYFAESLASLDEHLADDLVQIHADALVLLPRGQLMMRSVAMAFDAYLGEGQSGRFSRTV